MNSPQALAEYADATDVWVCASETLGSRWPYKDYLERGALHVAMVDLSWTGGLTEGRKIASLADTWHIGAHFHQYLHRHPLTIVDKAKEEVLSTDVVVTKFLRLS